MNILLIFPYFSNISFIYYSYISGFNDYIYKVVLEGLLLKGDNNDYLDNEKLTARGNYCFYSSFKYYPLYLSMNF